MLDLLLRCLVTVTLTTNVVCAIAPEPLEASSLVSESFAEVKTIAVFKPDDVFVPIIVRERLAEACIKGIVKPDIGANSDF